MRVAGVLADEEVCAVVAPLVVAAFKREYAAGRWPNDEVGQRATAWVAEIDKTALDLRERCSAAGIPAGIPTVDSAPTSADDRRLTAKEVAAMLGVGDREVRALAKRNTLPGVHDARGRWRFERLVVDAYVARRSDAKGVG
jgi:excisionase family DNA binding protein